MKMLVANWKMAPETESIALRLAKATFTAAQKYKKSLAVIACVPYIYLSPIKKGVRALTLGVQGIAPGVDSAATGMVSVAMVKNIGAAYAIVGHSESRARGDTPEVVKAQLDLVLAKRMTPILCVGEKERDNQGWYLCTVKEQLETSLAKVPKATLKNIIIAYEPVWAIGKDATRQATPSECREMIIFIRKIVTDLYDKKLAASMRIIYGGSVDEGNAARYLDEGSADGLLVGRVSLDAKKFAKLAASII